MSRILIADDQTDVLEALRILLKGEGHQTDAVTSLAGVFQALLREGLIDLVRPEIGIFGIGGTRRVAALAEPYYVAVAPRHNGSPVATAAAIHIAASIPNFFIQHVPLPAAAEDRAMRREIVSPALESGKGGFLDVTKSPGLGITVNEAALEKYRAA